MILKFRTSHIAKLERQLKKTKDGESTEEDSKDKEIVRSVILWLLLQLKILICCGVMVGKIQETFKTNLLNVSLESERKNLIGRYND